MGVTAHTHSPISHVHTPSPQTHTHSHTYSELAAPRSPDDGAGWGETVQRPMAKLHTHLQRLDPAESGPSVAPTRLYQPMPPITTGSFPGSPHTASALAAAILDHRYLSPGLLLWPTSYWPIPAAGRKNSAQPNCPPTPQPLLRRSCPRHVQVGWSR